jgi:putative transposase
VRFAYLHRQGARGQQVKRMCDLLEVSRSGYYAYVRVLEQPAKIRRGDLTLHLRELFVAHKRRYGSPRLSLELKASGFACCRNTVAKLMRREGLYAVSGRKYRPQTTQSGHAWPVADNLLQQQFEAEGPNQVWLADLSYVATDEGWLYLSAVMDLYSRRIVGWKAADHLRADLAMAALAMAAKRRRPGPGLVHHSDRGVQYACGAYQSLLQDLQMTPSMSASGNCYDNAPMESCIGTIKKECVQGTKFRTREEATQAIFEYIEGYYNTRRRHSSLGYLSPVEFEQTINRPVG